MALSLVYSKLVVGCDFSKSPHNIFNKKIERSILIFLNKLLNKNSNNQVTNFCF